MEILAVNYFIIEVIELKNCRFPVLFLKLNQIPLCLCKFLTNNKSGKYTKTFFRNHRLKDCSEEDR